MRILQNKTNINQSFSFIFSLMIKMRYSSMQIFGIIALVILACSSCQNRNNSSKSIAIINMCESIAKANNMIDRIIQSNYQTMEMHIQLYRKKTEKYYNLYKEIEQLCEKGKNIITEAEIELLKEAGQKKAISKDGINYTIDYKKIDDLDYSGSGDFILDEKALIIKSKINAIRTFILSDNTINTLGEAYFQKINYLLFTEDLEDGTSWEENLFEGKSLCETIYILTKLQSDILNAEYLYSNHLSNMVDNWSSLIPNKTVVVTEGPDWVEQGKELKTEIFLISYDSLEVPEVYIGNYDTVSYKLFGEEGRDWFKLKPNGKGGASFSQVYNKQGKYMIRGFIRVDRFKGQLIFPFSKEITVVEKCGE